MLELDSITIEKDFENQDSRDFEFLRKSGLDHIQSMSRKIWTDYNAHDPGITFLEVLCYAITDLGHRITAPIEDLIASSTGGVISEDDFPGAKSILTTKPITESDYRKLFIDIPGVKNAFLRKHKSEVFVHCSQKHRTDTDEEPKGVLSYKKELGEDFRPERSFELKGLYDVVFEVDSDIQQLDASDLERKNRIKEISKSIRELYHENRALCEDLVDVVEVSEYEFQVCGDIEIDKSANPIDTLVEVLFRIQEHVSPSIQRLSLSEMMDEGVEVDQIFNGPILKHGFITDENLSASKIKSEVRLSDLIQIVAETPGVVRIKDLNMMSCPCNEEKIIDQEDCEPLENPWKICFPEGFDRVLRLCLKNSVLNIFKDVIPINIDQVELQKRLQLRFEEHNRSLELSYDDIARPETQSIQIGQYRSVQNDLPSLYGVGELGLSPRLPEERHAQMLQLKAYLSFFDQILSSYFQHLKSIGKLFSTELDGHASYYPGSLEDIRGFEKIQKNPENFELDVKEHLGSLEDFTERKGALLDHLLGRFAENMNQYVWLMIDLFGIETRDASLWHKARMLDEYSELSYARAHGFDYFDKSKGIWNTLNVSGFQHRIARLLGIRNWTRHDVSKTNFDFKSKTTGGAEKWQWVINDKSSSVFSSDFDFDRRDEAEDEMWRIVSLAWDRENYRTEQIDDNKIIIELVEKSSQFIARHTRTFTTLAAAEKEIDSLVEYMFDKVSDEGIYLFENILFRPDEDDPNASKKFMEICMDDDCSQCEPVDPYSYRISIVLPGWTSRFSNMHFRSFAEDAIRSELPAHILCRICWIGTKEEDLEDGEKSQMIELEKLYRKWLQNKMSSPLKQHDNASLKKLVDHLHDLNSIYPIGRLHDCNVDGDGEKSIVLNRSAIGELKERNNGNE